MDHQQPPIDLNAATAQLVKLYADDILSRLSEVATRGHSRRRLLRQIETYVKDEVERRSTLRTLICRDRAVNLLDIFIPLDLIQNDRRRSAPTHQDAVTRKNGLLPTGRGGCGKSMMMRYWYLSAAQSGSHLPMFLNLRELNESTASIFERIAANLSPLFEIVPPNALLELWQDGRLALFLDGYDEVREEIRPRVRKDIASLSDTVGTNLLFVSSRPEEEFIGWNLDMASPAPLSLRQACELVNRARFDKGVSRQFIQELESRLFESHQDLLANPLLLTIMLLTYQDRATMPTSRHLFYDYAFEALYMRHDATKMGFRRELQCNCGPDEFRRMLAAFSFCASVEERLTYDSATFDIICGQAKRLTNLDIQPRAFLDDLTRSLCLIVPDGLLYTFVHRSFLEYFAALYIRYMPPNHQGRAIAWLASEARLSGTLDLLFDMDHELVEREYIIPELDRIVEHFGDHALKYVSDYTRMFDGTISFKYNNDDELNSVFCHHHSSVQFLDFLENHYDSFRRPTAHGDRNEPGKSWPEQIAALVDLVTEGEITSDPEGS